ncbi:MAG: hypothetical protein KDC56_12980, partial [Flavobacteriaceae bacterium]|nr:hypothetical protein [Flavobacteriaceae bacterium]
CYPCACIYLGKNSVYLPPIWASLTEEPGDFSVLVLGDFFRCDCSFTNLNEWPNDIWNGFHDIHNKGFPCHGLALRAAAHL